MKRSRIIDIREEIFAENSGFAESIREDMRRRGTLLVNVMGSPGTGKTSLLVEIVRRLGGEFRIGVVEGDVDSSIDADLLNREGASAVQIRTGGFCHLDSAMVRRGLDLLLSEPADPESGDPESGDPTSRESESCEAEPDQSGADDSAYFDLIFIENIGNLICPADHDTGAQLNIVLLSIPEGDNKPLKYPLVFRKADLLVVGKIDSPDFSRYDLDGVRKRVKLLNEHIRVFPLSCRTGEGIDPLISLLRSRVVSGRSGSRYGTGSGCGA